MSDTRWLRDLARVNREAEAEERSRLDERWDRLSAGELTPEEEAELRALAEASDEGREAYEAFRPLGAEFQARVAGAITAELKKPAPSSGEEPPPRLLPFRRSAWRGWTAAAAAAAAVLILLLWPPASPPLPVYTAELSGGIQSSRGAAEPVAVFGPGDLLTLAASPQQAVSGPVEATVLLAQGAELTPWDPPPPMEVAASGAVRLRVTVGEEIRLPPGSWRIWLVVGRRGRLPAGDEIAAGLRAGRTRQADWLAVPVDLRIADRAAP